MTYRAKTIDGQSSEVSFLTWDKVFEVEGEVIDQCQILKPLLDLRHSDFVNNIVASEKEHLLVSCYAECIIYLTSFFRSIP